MTRKPLVSVITIFLNAETFIQEAIESMLSQTYPHWELLLIDDGSTDASTAIAQAYARDFPQKVRYLHHEGQANRGMSASRNLGITSAHGDYIAFLDADDVYMPQKLQKQVEILEAHPSAAMVYGATKYWYSWTGRDIDRSKDRLRLLGVPPDTLRQPPELVRLFLQSKAQTPGTCSIMVRASILQHTGAFETTFTGMFEDQVFIYKVCLNAPVFVESGTWDKYRQHPRSHTRTSDRKGIYARHGQPNAAYHTFLQWVEKYFIAQNVTDSQIWEAWRQEMWPYRHPHRYRLLSLLKSVAQMPARARQFFAYYVRRGALDS